MQKEGERGRDKVSTWYCWNVSAFFKRNAKVRGADCWFNIYIKCRGVSERFCFCFQKKHTKFIFQLPTIYLAIKSNSFCCWMEFKSKSASSALGWFASSIVTVKVVNRTAERYTQWCVLGYSKSLPIIDTWRFFRWHDGELKVACSWNDERGATATAWKRANERTT